MVNVSIIYSNNKVAFQHCMSRDLNVVCRVLEIRDKEIMSLNHLICIRFVSTPKKMLPDLSRAGQIKA